VSDRYVTVATFPNSGEAELARGCLEEKGIPALVSGDLGATALVGMGNAATVQLQVPEPEMERARAALLATHQQAVWENRASGLPVTAGGRPAWICLGCDEHVDLEIEVCPSCGTLLADPSAPTSAMSLVEDADPEVVKTWVGDRLATRAFRAAIFGLFVLPPLGHLYSLWLLLRLRELQGELSETARSKIYTALVIDLIVVVPCLLVLLGCLLAMLIS
jgi:Putative prokaryotic signal transducing protein